MNDTRPLRHVRWWTFRPEEIAGALVVLLTRLLTLPRTPWELDELLFTRGVIDFEPQDSRPHPPGYPLLIGLGKVVRLFVDDPWLALVVLSVIASVIGFIAFARAVATMTADRTTGCIASLVFYFSASMLVHGTLALSDATMLMFVALALLAGAQLRAEPRAVTAAAFGLWISAAIGTRPQMAIALVPVFAVVVTTMKSWRHRALAVGAMGLVSLLWFAPLVAEAGGWNDYLALQKMQATHFAEHDAAESRGARSIASVGVRFVLHPWGPKEIALPLMIAALAGVVVLARQQRRAVMPAAVLSAIHVAFAVFAMDPADGARYSLPSMFFVAIAAAAGVVALGRLARLRAVAWIAIAAFAIASFAYASPILLTRRSVASPPAQAAAFAQKNYPVSTVILYDLSLRPHAQHLFEGFRVLPTEEGLQQFYARADVPLVHLADGGSQNSAAQEFSWPASDAYGKLTRNLYRVVSLEPVPPASRFRPVRGVSAPERTVDGHAWRWLEPEAVLDLPLLDATEVRIRLGLSADFPVVANRVEILMNGQPAGSADVTRQGVEMIVPLPAAQSRTITIRSAQSFVPAAVAGNRDVRTLAVQLLSLEQR